MPTWRTIVLLSAIVGVCCGVTRVAADSFELRLRMQRLQENGEYQRVTRPERWEAAHTAVIVCDVWDLHHCLNAVRRLEEFAPRLDQFLGEARRRGATIIHAPSDCMPAYADHPARLKTIAVPKAPKQPPEIEFWCSRIPSEEAAVYPIDQSDGGEDDDPAEHAQWSAKLAALGRNPGMPWKKQSDLITIDAERDFISDRGDEIWNVLEQRNIQNVILTGVHCNMCVLGRPFGLRQMTRNGKNVVLVRDLTDSMYNPQRWPFVDHFTGNDLVISHVERFVCPTITSDQLLGGEPFRWQADTRAQRDVTQLPTAPITDRSLLEKQWTLLEVAGAWRAATGGTVAEYSGKIWFRCAIRTPRTVLDSGTLSLQINEPDRPVELWVNGQRAEPHSSVEPGKKKTVQFTIPTEWLAPDDANLIVLGFEHRPGDRGLPFAPSIQAGSKRLPLSGRWQFRLGDDPSNATMPLPARFGASPDILHRLD